MELKSALSNTSLTFGL